MGGHGSSSGQSRGATSAPLALIARVQVALLLAATISSALQPVSASSAPQAQPEPQAYGEQSGVNIGEQAGGEQQPEGHDDEALPDVEAEDVVTSDDVQRMLVSQLESNIAVLQRAYEFDLKRCSFAPCSLVLCVHVSRLLSDLGDVSSHALLL